MHETHQPLAWQLINAFRGALIALVVAVAVIGATRAGAAEAKELVPMGRAAGIKLFSDGVLVVGTSQIDGRDPARDCGLKEGDIITHINSEEVDSIEEVRTLLQSIAGQPMSIRATRGEKQVQMTARAVQCTSDGTYKLGAWIRDSMAGIGTITYYDPQTGAFGALGHGINDVDTSLLMPLEHGSLMYAEVCDVKKGVSGQPGQLMGRFEVQRDLGSLSANTPGGIFGTLTEPGFSSLPAPLPVAAPAQVKTGKATILSNISGDHVEEYEVKILRLYSGSDNDTRDMMIQIVDPRLLEATGGIVQGMSGSPIIQDGKLVGAVTHVLVNDPTRGYGIFIENMLDAAG